MKGKRIWSVLAVLVFAAAVAALSCARQDKKAHTRDMFAMDTYFSMQAYGKSAEKALEASADRVRELEGRLSVTREGSDVWRINHGQAAAEGPNENKIAYEVSEDTYKLTAAAISLGDGTKGALDITLYPVLTKWGFTTGEYRIPAAAEIEEAIAEVDYRRIALEEGGTKLFVPEGMQLDFGAVAKGYAGDCVLEILREEGVTSAILDLGGNVQALGTKPDGSCWKVGVKDPFDPGKELGVLEVADKAVITSGGYERYFVGEDGQRYWHILDPEDGYPADSGLVSVTVVGSSGVMCDGLSTALFVMGKERAVDFWRENPEFDMILVTEEGRLYLTEGIAGCFHCLNGWEAEMILGNVK